MQLPMLHWLVNYWSNSFSRSFTKQFVLNRVQLRHFGPAILFAVVIFGLSISPGIPMPESIVSADKLGHMAMYGMLNWLVLKALFNTGQYSNRNLGFAFLAVTAYGAALEFVQGNFFPNRFFEVWDMVANAFGAGLSCFFFVLWQKPKSNANK
jgi:VanZ family protein